MSVVNPLAAVPFARRPLAWLALLALITSLLVPRNVQGIDAPVPDHLVVSEVVTGGASASDELIELHNPTTSALPLEGLELIYVTASGATISRRAAWEAGAPAVPPGGHALVANEAGTFAPIADAVYASGMAATGGSVAIRIIGASSAIDAVGWGTAASAWLEGAVPAAPEPASSLERLPGGALGSSQDTNDNATDFTHLLIPDPQNLGSAPTPDPGAPPVSPTPLPTAIPTPAVTPTPAADSTSVAAARALPDGAVVTIEATALTASDFHDGGGFVADASGGIALLVTDGAFERGSRLRVTGELDDRFSQRTLRAIGTGIAVLGSGTQPVPITAATGAVNETVEGSLVRVIGTVIGGATTLTSALAFDLDDGSGAIRVLVGAGSGIDTAGWAAGATLELVGVAGQRDSSGSGVAGYRVMPRDASDILEVGAASPSSSPTSSASPGDPSPSATPNPAGVSSVAEARAAPKNARLRVRGVVTLASGVVDGPTAVIQDGTGAIVLRLGDDAGRLALGQAIDVAGTRSTKSGMETLRVTQPPTRLGSGTEPAPREVRSGEAGESNEARLVVVRGALVKAARRSSSGSVSFDIDDGSGPLHVVLGAVLQAGDDALAAGTWVEVRGVLGQVTTGAQPLRGYRIWPRTVADVRIVAAAAGAGSQPTADGPGSGVAATASLDEVGGPDLAALRVGATLVAGPWPELGVGGLLWDGTRLVAISPESSDLVAALIGSRQPPLAVEMAGLTAVGSHPKTGVALVALGTGPGQLTLGSGPLAAPSASLARREHPAWSALVGRLQATAGGGQLHVPGGGMAALDYRCDDGELASGSIGVTGIALGDPVRLVVPCGGVRPAPSVVRRASAGLVARPSSPEATAGAEARDAEDPRRSFAAILLGLAAAMVGAAAAARRWLERAPSDPADEAPAGVEEPMPADPPRLTLVPVPRKHGS